MKKLEKLTKKQKDLMIEVRDEWIDIALHKGPKIDKEECEAGIKWMYYASSLKEPKVIFVKGPKDFAKKFTDSVKNSVGASVRDSVWDGVWDSVKNSVGDSVKNSVKNSVRDSVKNSVRDSVRDSVWDGVWDSVKNSVGDSVKNSVGDSVSWTCLSGDAEFGAWYEYYKKINIVQQEDADKYIGYLRTGAFYVFFFEKVAFIMERPIDVFQDEQKRLHSIEKPAIEWRDGTKLYYINGVQFDEKLWKKVVKDKLKIQEVFAIENTEQRRIAYEFMDKLKMKKLKNYEVLDHRDKDERGKMDEIVKFEIKGFDEPFIYYHCECPTTGRRYFIQTESRICIEAKNKSFGVEDVSWINEW